MQKTTAEFLPSLLSYNKPFFHASRGKREKFKGQDHDPEKDTRQSATRGEQNCLSTSKTFTPTRYMLWPKPHDPDPGRCTDQRSRT